MRAFCRGVFGAGLLAASALLLPAAAGAQTLAGTVQDASGAVLPGVTVEASSPALIEKVRTAVTDGTGQYRIVDLRPGIYTLTFTLPGFTTVRREGVEVSGNQTIAINAEMRVGALEETITVVGETPVVDVQSTRRQTVITSDVVSTIPIARGYGNILATVPGIQIAGAGGLTSSPGVAPSFFTANGGRSNEGRVQIAGMNVGSAFNGGGVAAFQYPIGESEEVQITVSGGLGEADTGGPVLNIVPREGGNTFRGNVFVSEAGKWSQGDNLNDQLRAVGINRPAGLVRNWDESASLGGPLKRERVWFYSTLRSVGNIQRVLDNGRTTYPNRNAFNAASWIYEPDRNVEERGAQTATQLAVRVTAQLTPRNKVGFYHDYNWTCWGSSLVEDRGCRPRTSEWIALGSAVTSPESGTGWDNREKIIQATYSSPITNRLLLEGGYSTFISKWGGHPVPGSERSMELVPVTEQNGSVYGVANFTYRGLTNYTHNEQMPNTWRGSLSYVTGSHNVKIGTQGAYHIHKSFLDAANTTQLTYTFNSCVRNPGVPVTAPCTVGVNGMFVPTPVSVTTWIPNYLHNITTFQAYYIQDQWTIDRVTLQGALRYEWAKSWHPEGLNGVIANRWTPAIRDPHTEGVRGYHDLSPRFGVAWDVFGTGKTAVRVNLGHYLQSANNEGLYVVNNPADGRVRSQTRTWTDRNGNFIVDCDLRPTSTASQDVPGGDLCGPVTGNGLNFGSVVRTTTVDPNVLEGWGIRNYDWVFGASFEQEIIPRLSVQFTYNRRWWGNFFVTDNLNVGPGDFDVATLTAPRHSLLPNGGGYPVSFRVPRTNVPQRNYFTFAGERVCTAEAPCPNGATSGTFDYGDQTARYESFQVTGRARTAWGLVLQGGTTTGRGVRDQCEIERWVPEINVGRVEGCKVTEPWLTTLNGLASYEIPKIAVLVSAVMRSQPGTQPGATVGSAGGSLAANWTVSNIDIFNAIGRNLIACPPGIAPAACTATQTVNLLLPGQVYQKRLNSFDVRFAKIFRFGGRRADVGIDLYNIINANTETAYNQTFGTDGTNLWQPTSIQNPRFARFNVRVDF